MTDFSYETFVGESYEVNGSFGKFVDSSGDPVDMAYTYCAILNANGLDAKFTQ